MSDVKHFKSGELIALVDELLSRDTRVWITVTGMSMYPFLRANRDSVELSGASFDDVKKGDIVLVKRESGEYVLHRVVKRVRDGFYLVGDAQQYVEGPLSPGQLLAVVTTMKRRGRIFDCKSLPVRMAVQIWLLLLPFRHVIFRAGRLFLGPLRKRRRNT